MGYFSWKTSDTNKTIYNIRSDHWQPMPVVMLAPDGRRWEEAEYEGYGVFGGKDFFELLAEINGKKTRDEGIALCYSGEPHIKPRLTESFDTKWEELPDSPEARGQGFWAEEEI